MCVPVPVVSVYTDTTDNTLPRTQRGLTPGKAVALLCPFLFVARAEVEELAGRVFSFFPLQSLMAAQQDHELGRCCSCRSSALAGVEGGLVGAWRRFLVSAGDSGICVRGSLRREKL